MERFIDYKLVKHNNTVIFLFDVHHEQPTPLQWTFAIEEFKEAMAALKEKNVQFAYILDIRLMGILSINQVKEFVTLLKDMSVFVESKLICSAVIAEGNIIKVIFEMVKLFYNTKKPLKIVNNMEDATQYIQEMKADSLNLF